MVQRQSTFLSQKMEKIVDLTDKSHSVYNQIKRGDIEGCKKSVQVHTKRLAGVPFRITSKTTGESPYCSH